MANREHVERGIYRRHHKRQDVWFYDVVYPDPHGKMRWQYKVGTTLEQARKKRRKLLGQVASGEWVDPKLKKAREMTFGSYAEQFIREYAAERRSTYYRDTITGRRPDKRPKGILAFFGRFTLTELESDPKLFDQYRRKRLADGYSPGTVRKELLVLNKMFGEAKRLGLVRSNPVPEVEKPREPKRGDVRPLNRAEIGSTLAEIEDRVPWLGPLFRFALGTGARLKEAALVTWDRIDRDSAVVRISADNKTGDPRQVPLGKFAAAALDTLPDVRSVTGHVFLDEQGRPLTDDAGRNRVSQRTAAAMRRAGVSGASFKSIRPTIGTTLAEAGSSDLLIAELLGHAWAKSNVTGRHYIRVRVDHLRPLMAALDRWLLAEDPAEVGPGLDSNCSDRQQASAG